MTKELQISIEKLYIVFAKYPFRFTDGCPCCVSEENKGALHSKLLRDLQEEDLSRYAFKAMTTWGDVEDFKHYLPRIFELLVTKDFIVDSFVVLGKLNYGKWKSWEIEEQQVIRELLLNWWEDVITNKDYFDDQLFVEINKIIEDIGLLLDRWHINIEENSFKVFVDFLYKNYSFIKNTDFFGDTDKVSKMRILDWINDKKGVVEKGFFHYASIDSEFAEKISDTLYILEHS